MNLNSLKKRRGMTLIELSIVIVVLGIIIGLVTYGLRTAGAGAQDSANKLKVNQQATTIRLELNKYQDEYGSMQDGETLIKLTKRDSEHPNWTPLSEKDVLDPWNEPYFLCRDDAGEQQICSRGADKKEGGQGKDADFMLTREDSYPQWLSGKKK